MTILTQTYSRAVEIDQLHQFFQRRGISDKIQIEQKDQSLYTFSSDYFTEHELHRVLDDACDEVLTVGYEDFLDIFSPIYYIGDMPKIREFQKQYPKHYDRFITEAA